MSVCSRIEEGSPQGLPHTIAWLIGIILLMEAGTSPAPTVLVGAAVAAGPALAADPTAQMRVQPVAELPGETALRLMLRKLQSTGTFMQITAHPDDEDNALLARLSHGDGMRAVLVSATRGEGGQNEIGPELFEALGVLRTEETLAVHRFDGAEQYFTRAVDFGYSFSVDESIERWGRKEIVGDLVHHIRAIRPDVIVGFVCGGEGGGQHHQAATVLTLEAFRAAADPRAYSDQEGSDHLRPWQTTRVFCTDSFAARGQKTAPDVLPVSPSAFDPLLGRTYAELGLEARSMHKCQGTSQLLMLPGAASNRSYRIRDAAGGPPGVAPPSLFDGIDTSLPGLARFAPRPPALLVTSLKSIAGTVTAAEESIARRGPAGAVELLATGLRMVRGLRTSVAGMALDDRARFEIDVRLELKERQFEQALLLATSARLEALADDGVIIPGQPLSVTAYASAHARTPVRVQRVAIAGLDGDAAGCARVVDVQPGSALTCRMSLKVPDAAHETTTYWTPRPDAARYDFDPDAPFGAPFRPSPFRATFHLIIAGAELAVERVIQFRYDQVLAGEKRMELHVVPAFNVRVSPATLVVPRGGGARDIEVAVGNNMKGAASASLVTNLPSGWTAPAAQKVSFAREDEEVTLRIPVQPPKGAAASEALVELQVQASDAAPAQAARGYQAVEYPHIHRRHLASPARVRVKVIDVTIAPGLRVGYVMGVGDQVPQAIEQLGAQVHLLEPAELARADLSTYDVIVTGVRAYERRADLRAHNHRLIAYASKGGTVLVQYNKFEFNEAQYGPYPARVSSNRVTDENAPVELLVPDHPAFTRPNRIGAGAWSGWVQERGLYFLGERDPRYVDLVRTADPFPFNAGPKTGALVEARVGQGRWIYIGLGLWRQLPAGTTGAYQLLANLLSLGK